MTPSLTGRRSPDPHPVGRRFKPDYLDTPVFQGNREGETR